MVPYVPEQGGDRVHHAFADHALATHLEALSAEELRAFARVALADDDEPAAAGLEVAGGMALFIESGSPVNQASGLGMREPVTSDQAAQVSEFFRSRGDRGAVLVCPLAHGSVLEEFGALGWRADGFQNVLVREYREQDDFGPAGDADIEIVEAVDDEAKAIWAHVAAVGFAAPLDPALPKLRLAHLVTQRPGARFFTAFVDGSPVGTGELQCAGGVAWLSADATLPHARGRGVQRALQRHRLALGAELGCEMAVSEAVPGSSSQRNMERAGFRVAYTRIELLGPEA